MEVLKTRQLNKISQPSLWPRLVEAEKKILNSSLRKKANGSCVFESSTTFFDNDIPVILNMVAKKTGQGKSFLEIGGGTGIVSIAATEYFNVTYLETQTFLCKIAKKLYKNVYGNKPAKDRINFIRAKIEDYFPSRPFDVIYIVSPLVQDKFIEIDPICRLLASGGYLIQGYWGQTLAFEPCDETGMPIFSNINNPSYLPTGWELPKINGIEKNGVIYPPQSEGIGFVVLKRT